MGIRLSADDARRILTKMAVSHSAKPDRVAAAEFVHGDSAQDQKAGRAIPSSCIHLATLRLGRATPLSKWSFLIVRRRHREKWSESMITRVGIHGMAILLDPTLKTDVKLDDFWFLWSLPLVITLIGVVALLPSLGGAWLLLRWRRGGAAAAGNMRGER